MMQKLLQMTKGLRLPLFLCFVLATGQAQAQSRNVTGTVKDGTTGEFLPGVSIVVKGTSLGTISDVNGAYSVQVNSDDDVLIFSFVGYEKAELPVSGRTTVDVQMKSDIATLEEIVVVGYGEQKKSVVTGAISSVKAKELESMPITRIEQALQGRTSGLTIAANSGQPGSAATIRVRGITTLSDNFNGNNPLWVVDGVVVDNGGIGYLNQSDIESIEVLKDASSQAIYGARAAAGVILVTTKRGKEGNIKVNYNGFFGTSAPARKLDMLNATQYATLRNESAMAAGGSAVFTDPQSLGKGTDWQGKIFNNSAQRQNHELSISGGNERSTFYTSFGYLDQEGIVSTDISNYNRVNLRLNSTHKLAKWLTVGQNVGYARTKNLSIGDTNREFGGPLSSSINMDPITPAIETDPVKAAASPYNQPGVLRTSDGSPYGISSIVGQELTNPMAYVQTRLGNYNWANDIVGNAYAEIKPIKGLTFRSTVGGKLAFWGQESFTPLFYLNSSTKTSQNSFRRENNKVFNWNLENTITYTKTIDVHTFSVLLGQGAYQDNDTRGAVVTYFNIPADNFDEASMNYAVPTANRNASASEGQLHTVSSLFARLNYNYNEKYLLTGIIRRDGSSKFGVNNRFGYFPSFSLGWVVSNENFWAQNQTINFFKIRGGYGVVGNDAIGDFQFYSIIGGGRNYTMGNTDAYLNGFSPNTLPNPDLKWEATSQTNIGFEATLLGNLTVNFDWYKKVSSDILRNPRIPSYVGMVSDPAANVADMENTGIELELGYKTRVGDVDFSVNGNVSHMKNKITGLGNGLQFLSGGETFQASRFPITRNAVGQPVYSFYGFERRGLFQTIEDVMAYTNSEGKVIQPNARPGDIIWVDQDDDGDIDADDRTFIGNPTPSWTYGMTLTAAWKGFDVVVFGQGAAGHDIFQGLRRLDVSNANWQTKALGRWTGPGTSNDYPRLVNGDPNNNFANPSTLYLEKGDYFRLKTVQIGYTLPKGLISKAGLERARVYVMSENLLTFTNYTGFDPEIGGNAMSIDKGIYPQARSFMVGVNLGF